ncbi:MAG: ligase-associated DNA damage response DEXH box helicase [Planctomycetota bacterium]
MPLAALQQLRDWMATRRWTPFAFQEATWAAFLRGESGLISVPTGAGKTTAATFGPLAEIVAGGQRGLQLVYLSPLRAVSRDIERALKEPLEGLGVAHRVRVESRTGDTSTWRKKKQREQLPEVLVTTPESLTVLLSYPDTPAHFTQLRAVVVDEWHELMSSRRGTQTELALARLRHFAPQARSWAVSATIANMDEAAQTAVGTGRDFTLITDPALERQVHVECILPRDIDSFPWHGHLGLKMLPDVLDRLDLKQSTLLFTNIRARAERWYRAIHDAKPRWRHRLALHHGSLDQTERARVEAGLRSGDVRIVVCTSSLDLGVDFGPVERVFQIGSPKGVSRLIQRAGRAAHRPGMPCTVICVPTHALELVEIAAARDAVQRREVEPRKPLLKPLDVLTQHLVTCGLGGGFEPAGLFDEVRAATSYADLTREEFEHALALMRDGGNVLQSYDEYRRLHPENGPASRHTVPDERIGRLHRLNIGTIMADSTIRVRHVNGRDMGSIEEGFIAMMKAGDTFLFAGQMLEFVSIRDMVARVRNARAPSGVTPAWSGGRMPISTCLSHAVRRTLQQVADGSASADELLAAAPVLDAQRRLSHIPAADELLVELGETSDGHHMWLYPFEGRLVHEGLAALLALRLSRTQSATFGMSYTDSGIEMVTPVPVPWRDALADPRLFEAEHLVADIVETLNLAELARRQFREIARVSGLVFQSHPGTRHTMGQLQASSGLIYDVFRKFDPGNLLLAQARREVLDAHLEQERLLATLARLRAATQVIKVVSRPTPLGFPLLVDRLGAQLTTESLRERIERMKAEWAIQFEAEDVG